MIAQPQCLVVVQQNTLQSYIVTPERRELELSVAYKWIREWVAANSSNGRKMRHHTKHFSKSLITQEVVESQHYKKNKRLIPCVLQPGWCYRTSGMSSKLKRVFWRGRFVSFNIWNYFFTCIPPPGQTTVAAELPDNPLKKLV